MGRVDNIRCVLWSISISEMRTMNLFNKISRTKIDYLNFAFLTYLHSRET